MHGQLASQFKDQSLERDALDTIAVSEAQALLERFSTLVRDSGSPDEHAAGEYIASRLRALGIPVTVHAPDLYLSIPIRSELRVVGGRSPRDIVSRPPAFSLSTGGDEASGEVVYVPSKYAGGRGSLFDTPKAAETGGGVDPEALAAEAAAGGLRVSLRTWLKEGWMKCLLPVVEIRGQQEPDEFVLVHGHYDSWYVGIGDNATGDATLLELARVLHGLKDRLKRSVRIAWWPGHSTGRYAGSTWYADTFADELDEWCVAHVNIDSPGCAGATAYEEVMWMTEAEGLCSTAIADAVGERARGVRPLRAGDYSFNVIADLDELGAEYARWRANAESRAEVGSDVDRRPANTVLRRLARHLVPLNYARGERFDHDPATKFGPVPRLEDATRIASVESDRRGFMRTGLVRERNKVRAILRAARRELV